MPDSHIYTHAHTHTHILSHSVAYNTHISCIVVFVTFLTVARPFIAATACNSRKAHPLLGLGVVFHIVERGDRSQKRTDRKGTSKRGWKDGKAKSVLAPPNSLVCHDTFFSLAMIRGETP